MNWVPAKSEVIAGCEQERAGDQEQGDDAFCLHGTNLQSTLLLRRLGFETQGNIHHCRRLRWIFTDVKKRPRLKPAAWTRRRPAGAGLWRGSSRGYRRRRGGSLCLDAGAVVLGDAHAVEAAIHEDEGDEEEDHADAGLQVLVRHRHRDLDSEEAEEGGELDDGIHRDG